MFCASRQRHQKYTCSRIMQIQQAILGKCTYCTMVQIYGTSCTRSAGKGRPMDDYEDYRFVILLLLLFLKYLMACFRGTMDTSSLLSLPAPFVGFGTITISRAFTRKIQDRRSQIRDRKSTPKIADLDLEIRWENCDFFDLILDRFPKSLAL